MRISQGIFQIIVALFQVCIAKEVDVAEEVARFSTSNAFQCINVIYSHGRERDAAHILKSLYAKNVLAKTMKMQDVLDQRQSRNQLQQGKINLEEKFIWLPQRQDVEERATLLVLLEILDRTRIKNSLLILDFNLDWKEIYARADLNAYFYTFSIHSKQQWHQIFAVNKATKVIIRQLHFETVNGQRMVDEQHELQNMTITCSSLAHNKESVLGECDDITLRCRNNSGFFWDVIDLLESLINVTVVAYKEPTNQWGALPQFSNGTEKSLQWNGILGSLEKRDHHIGSAFWAPTMERFDFFDMCTAWFRTYAIFFTPKKTPGDTFFLLRPFNTLAWEAIGLVAFAILVLKHFKNAQRDGQNMNSTKVLILSANVFFLLLHGFYAAALTMFNVTQKGVPFTNLEEAIAAYPSWKLIVPKETVARVTFLMSRQTTAYKELLKRIDVNDIDTVVDSLEQGLQRAQDSRSVLLSSLLDVSQQRSLESSSSLKMIPLRCLPLFVVFGHNSPLTPSFQWGLLQLWESGQTRHIIDNYLVKSSSNDIDEGPSAITLEETKLALFAMMIAILCSLILLLMEKCCFNSTTFIGTGKSHQELVELPEQNHDNCGNHLCHCRA